MKSIKLIISLFAIIGTFTITSCGDDDNSIPEPPTPEPTCTDGIMNGDETGVDCGGSCSPCDTGEAEMVELEGGLETMTLDPEKIYVLDRFVYVPDGETLTIPAGTIIKAKDGDGADASALIIARGGKINAVGTASQPIIFTSINDDIQPGETESTLEYTDSGLWGGLIILGNAPSSVQDGDSIDGNGEVGAIEGVPSDFSFSRYGGDVPNDDSGTLDYISIRFTGTTLATNSEIQGLTLGGVGSETQISNIEVFASADDGVEFFGGTVDVTNILIAYQEDDGIDIDQSYAGTVDNGLVLLYNQVPGNDGFEIDGPESETANTGGMFTITNTTVMQKGGARMARIKSDAQGTIQNSAFIDFAVVVDDAGTPDDTSDDNPSEQRLMDDGASNVTIQDSEFNISSQEDAIENNGAFTLSDLLFDVSSFTVGADTSQFDWTYSKAKGLF